VFGGSFENHQVWGIRMDLKTWLVFLKKIKLKKKISIFIYLFIIFIFKKPGQGFKKL
jgi:hypothetical protein